MTMGIAEKIKAEGRSRKLSSAGPASDRGTPAPVTAKQTSSPAILPPPKIEKPAPKKKGTAAPVKRGPKPKAKEKKVEGQSKFYPYVTISELMLVL
jgi:COMPASS component SPP1